MTDNKNGSKLHLRSHSLCSDHLLSTVTAFEPSVCQSVTTITPNFQQQTLIGIEALNGAEFDGGYEQFNRNNNNDDVDRTVYFGRRISRVYDVQRPLLPNNWLEKVFQRRECIKFIPANDHSERCQCGRATVSHSQLALSRFTSVVMRRGQLGPTTGQIVGNSWTIGACTDCSPTDAYGIIEFQGGLHVHKAHYVRLSFDTHPEDVMTLMEKAWNLERPRLVISVHGGTADFNLPEKLGHIFREGLLKAAETTGAWVITYGLDSGVVKHVARALDEAGISARMRSRIVMIGIAPWGLLHQRENLIGRDAHISYDRQNPSLGYGNGLVLNDRHSYFLLADNGTVGRNGAEIVLRRRFEEYLAQKSTTTECRGRIPIICVALEGGLCTLNAICQYLNGQPAIPVIISEGSGRISDLFAFTEKHLDSHGNLPVDVRFKLLAQIKQLNSKSGMMDSLAAEAILERIIVLCASHRNKLLTIFRVRDSPRLDQNDQQMDRVILQALLHGQQLSIVNQLFLTLAWGRVDIAKSEIFRAGQIPVDSDWLIQPMMEALLEEKVDFVRLFLEQGLSPKRFLTFQRLEQLYNADSSLGPLMVTKRGANWGQEKRHFSLPEIGAAIERLMGNSFRSTYTMRAFKTRYERSKCADGTQHQLRRTVTRQFSSLQMCLGGSFELDESTVPQRKSAVVSPPIHPGMPQQLQPDFAFPFNELMLWAVLTRRNELAKLFWQYGEEPMPKALAAIRLYKCMSREAAHDYTEVEVSNFLRECAQEFRECSLELLNHCHRQDQRLTMRLLTAELPNWGNHTCLSLAVIANNKRFLAHPCCQVLLAELWHGGLRFRSQSNVKVILGLLCPPSILLLDFKNPNSNENKMKGETKAVEYGMPTKKTVEHDEAQNLLNGHNNNGIAATSKQNDQSFTPTTFLNNVLSKFTLFYSAPITCFWVWSISFLLFMLALIYVLLIEFPQEVAPIEWLLFVYVLAFAMEHFRKLLVLEASSVFEKITLFYNKYWNILTTVAILSYFLGFGLRFDPTKIHTHSRVILAATSVLWHMKLFDFLSVHPRIGPYITMAGKMVLAMSYIIVLLLLTLMAFGVARQSITFPHEKWAWILVRNIFYKPYFMLYGEVYAGEIDTCGDEGTNCVPGYWIPPLLMVAFLLIANILLINMLIAIFNNIFNVTNAMSQQVWLFQRYGQVLEYKSTPILPPPFTPIAHLLMLLRRFCKSESVCPFHQSPPKPQSIMDGDFALKVQLRPEDLRQVQDFEEDCMDDLSRRKYRSKNNLEGQKLVEKDQQKHQHLSGDKGILTELQKLQQKLEQIGQTQQRLLTLINQNQQQSCDKAAKKPQPMTNWPKKLIPRARIQPISCSAPVAGTNNFAQFEGIPEGYSSVRLRSSPNIPVAPAGNEEHPHFTVDEANGNGNRHGEDEGVIRNNNDEAEGFAMAERQRNYSVSLGEDLEQMYGMVRRWTNT